jgi:hypothetical protein
VVIRRALTGVCPGLAQVILQNLFDADFVAKNTDLPFLVRLDTLQPLRRGVRQLSCPNIGEREFCQTRREDSTSDADRPYAVESMQVDSSRRLGQNGHNLVAVTRDEWVNTLPNWE